MSAHILVAYTSRKGSTAEIALAVAKELEKSGASVTVSDMTTVSSLEGYNAVVIGAPVYTGKVARDVAIFARRSPGQPQPGAGSGICHRYCPRISEDR